MKTRNILLSFVRLAGGEAIGRTATFVLFMYLTRSYGVQILGVVALAQTVASYVMELSDQGLKLIGSRLLARNPGLASHLVPIVYKRRMAFTAGAVLLGAVYALLGPVPASAKLCVLAFVFAAVPYAFALDWVAWGLGQFGVLATWRSSVSVLYVALAIVAMRLTMRPIASISGANILSGLVGAGFLWIIWRVRWKPIHSRTQSDAVLNAARDELRAKKALALGSANLLNLVFMNADILLLGAMTNTYEVGRYSAACKPLYIIFMGFWLLTDVLYPHLAKLEAEPGAQKILLISLAALAGSASVAALALGYFAPQILTLIYGSTVGAAGLFRILLIALPLDFCFSLLWTVLVSRGYDRVVLYSLATAAATNILMNVVFIPRFHANAAAWATVASYALLFSAVFILVLKKKVLSGAERGEPVTAWA
jgi:O-antigen/teichoic acid export membrane protein